MDVRRNTLEGKTLEGEKLDKLTLARRQATVNIIVRKPNSQIKIQKLENLELLDFFGHKNIIVAIELKVAF